MDRDTFLIKSNKAHNSKFTYPDFDNYNDILVKVPIICPTHGLFYQNPYDHCRGIGCRNCLFDSLKTWTKDEDDFLIANYKKNKSLWCSKKLNKSQHSIRGRAAFLNIVSKQKYCNPNVPAYLWNSLLARAKSKSFQKCDIDFDSDYILDLYNSQNRKCALSGWNIIFSNDHLKNTASIDRIDSNIGYIKTNIQLTHKIVNRCKLNLPENLFLQLCKSVYTHNRSLADYRTIKWEDDISNDTIFPIMTEYEFSDDFVLENNKINKVSHLD